MAPIQLAKFHRFQKSVSICFQVSSVSVVITFSCSLLMIALHTSFTISFTVEQWQLIAKISGSAASEKILAIMHMSEIGRCTLGRECTVAHAVPIMVCWWKVVFLFDSVCVVLKNRLPYVLYHTICS